MKNKLVLILLAPIALAVPDSPAATRTWSGLSSVDNLWTDAANWSGSARPAASDDVYFPGSPRAVSQNDLLSSLRSITFGVAGYEIIGNPLILTNGITATNASGGNVLVSTIALGANQSFTNLHTGAVLELITLDLNGRGLTLGGAGTNILDVLQDSAGGGSLTNNGTGVLLSLGTNSSFTGPTALNAGTNLFIGHQQRSPMTWIAGTLGGTGTIGTVTASGASAKQFVPGYLGGPGSLFVSNLVLNSAVTVSFQINGTNYDTDYNHILIGNSGSATLGSATLNVAFDTNNFSPLVGTPFYLFLTAPSGIMGGIFTNLPEGSTFTNNGVVCQVSYDFGHGVVLTVTNILSTGVSRYWTGGAGDELWSNPTNWQNNIAPQQGDTLLFEQGHILGNLNFIVTSNDLPAEMTFDAIHFQIYRSSAKGFRLLGNSLRLNSGMFLESEAVGAQAFDNGTYYISNHVSLNNSQPFTNGLYANLQLAGGVELGPNRLSVLAPLFNVGIGAVLFDAPITGAGVFELDDGVGTVALDVSNAITGSIAVNQGTLVAQHPQALGSASSGPVHVGANAVLNLPLANTTYTGSSIVLTGIVQTAVSNVTLAPALTSAGSNSLIVVSNSSALARPSLTLLGPVTNSAQLTYVGGSSAALQLPAGAVVRGGGLLKILKPLFADGTIHNTVQLSDGHFTTLSSVGQIDTLIATNWSTITPGLALDTNLAYNPVQVGTLRMGGALSTISFTLFPNRPGGGPTNTQVIATNVPTLGNATLTVFSETNLTPNQQFTLIRNLSSAPIPDTFNNLPEGAFLTAHTNFGLRISYVGGAGHDVVVTVQSNTPPVFAASVTNLTVNEHTNLFYTNKITDFESADTNFSWTLLPPSPAGLVLNPTTGVLTWTPDEGQATNSPYTVLCKVTDSFTPLMSATGTVIIAVNDINLPPVPITNGLNTNILAGHTLTMQLQATDPDIPAQPLTWSAISLPANGAVSFTTNGLFTYTPNPLLFGTNTVIVKVCDYDPSAVNSTSICVTVTFKVQVIRNGIVTHTNDTTDTNDVRWPGSLRQVITDMATNLSGGHVEFNIPGSGPFKIAPLTILPLLGDNTFIDGYTQPGAQPNTNTIGTGAKIMIELSGENIPSQIGLQSANGVTIRGLCVNRFTNGYAITMGSCCGTGNFCDKSGEAVEGCFLGTDTSGSNSLPNAYGIGIACTHGSRLGGPDVSQRNLISGNVLNGVQAGGHPTSITIQNNLIGTDRTGTNALPNGSTGISMSSDGGMSGLTIADNVIGANAGYGAYPNGPNDVFVRNKIGVGADGVTPLGNAAAGLYLQGTGHLVGGTNTADANLIAYNRGFGVDVAGANISVLANSIFRNTDRAIKLESGANNNQNAPLLTNATPATGGLTIKGTSTNRTYRLEFFHNADFSPSNASQAWTFLGATNVTTDISTNASFSVTFLTNLPTGFITATATDTNGNTSGISDGIAFTGSITPPVLTIQNLGTQVRLLWANSLANFLLLSNASLADTNGWGTVPGPPGNDGQHFFRDLPATSSTSFFRLRSP